MILRVTHYKSYRAMKYRVVEANFPRLLLLEIKDAEN